MTQTPRQPNPADSHSVSIIGLSCRFPGARDAEGFLDLVLSGASAVTAVPDDRWTDDHPAIVAARSAGVEVGDSGGFLTDVDLFDAPYFGIAPLEADLVDPQQRLLLEEADTALANAGMSMETIRGTRTAVYAACGGVDYAKLLDRHPQRAELIGLHSATGTSPSVGANRISYTFGLTGPSLTVDTACSSSLVALHHARNALLRGEADMAVVAAANLMLDPATTVALSRARMLSATGRCAVFDAGADGYVRAEGCGALVLKRTADAVAAGDRIRAEVIGSAVNHDGRSNGLTAPRTGAQVEVIEAALDDAGIAGERVGYLEAHGTGTPLGDPIEVEAITRVFGARRSALAIGSVKANIGHTEAAAGLAGLIKTVLLAEHGTIAGNPCLDELNPRIASVVTADVDVPRVPVEWPTDEANQRIAGVSSFSFGGTNAHVVVACRAEDPAEPDAVHPGPVAVLAGGKREHALRETCGRLADALSKDSSRRALLDIAATGLRVTRQRHRAAVVGDDPATVEDALRAIAEDRFSPRAVLASAAEEEPEMVWCFAGQGSERAGMGTMLASRHPDFRTISDGVADEFAAAGYDLHAALENPEALRETRHAQAAIFAFEYTLATWLLRQGIRPAALVGHSIGEVVGAAVAGMLTLPDAVRLVLARGAAMSDPCGAGSMLAVACGEQRVRDLIADAGVADVGLAAVNAPERVVVSGPSTAIAAFGEHAAGQGVRTTPLPSEVAFHSPLLEPAREKFVADIADIEWQAPSIPLYSTVTGELGGREMMSGEYWGDQLVRPVRFAAAFGSALRAGCEAGIEIAADDTLTRVTATIARAEGIETAFLVSCGSRDADEATALTRAMARLRVAGVPVSDDALVPRSLGRPRTVGWPAPPYERTRHWLPASAVESETVAGTIAGPVREVEVQSGRTVWTWHRRVDAQTMPSVADHRIGGRVLLPGAFYLEIFRSCARQLGFAPAAGLTDVRYESVLDLSEPRELETTMRVDSAGTAAWTVRSRAERDGARWSVHATGRGSVP